MTKHRRSGSAGGSVVVVGDIRAVQGKPVAVFDLDGVLIDSSERFKASLKEAGVSEEEFRSDPAARRKVWRIFLSERFIHLDRPVAEAVELAKERKRSGYAILIVTGRPSSLIHASLRQLSEAGVPYDAVIFRSEGNRRRDARYKFEALDSIGLKRIAEAHDDSPEVCETYAYYVDGLVYYWYTPGRYLVIPPLVAYVDGSAVKLDAPDYVSLFRELEKPRVVRYLGREFAVRDALDASLLLGYLRWEVLNNLFNAPPVYPVLLREILEAYRTDLLEYGKKPRRLVFDGREYPSVADVDLDSILHDATRLMYQYADEVAEAIVYSMYSASSPATYQLQLLTYRLLINTAETRSRAEPPPTPPQAPKVRSAVEIKSRFGALKELAVWTAFNIGEAFEFPLEEPEGFTLVVKMGTVMLVASEELGVEAPPIQEGVDHSRLSMLVRELKAYAAVSYKYAARVRDARRRMKDVAERYGLKGTVYAYVYGGRVAAVLVLDLGKHSPAQDRLSLSRSGGGVG